MGGVAAAPRSVFGGFGSIGITLGLFGVLASYLACLHRVEIDAQAVVAFGVWSFVALCLAFVVDRFFKYALAIAVLLIAAMWWTGSRGFDTAVSQSRATRAAICDKISFDFLPDVPVKDWVC